MNDIPIIKGRTKLLYSLGNLSITSCLETGFMAAAARFCNNIKVKEFILQSRF